MQTTHFIDLKARCPSGEGEDSYRVEVLAGDRLVLAEDIAKAADGVAGAAEYQEPLTQRLADTLGVPVKTFGTHCGGRVATTVYCEPRAGVALRASA